MSSFFSSGAVDTRSIDRDKLDEGTYRVRLTDAADHIGAYTGSRTQFNFTVLAGPGSIGSSKSEIVGHTYDQQWKADRARGSICAILGAFMGLDREAAGRKVNGETFIANTRTVNYASGGKDVAGATRDASDLPLVKSGAEAMLVVKPYFDRKTGKRKVNPKTGKPSVVYDLFPLSSGLVPTAMSAETESFVDDGDEAPAAPETSAPTVDALEKAAAAGWRPNPNAPGYFYAKGEPKQLKADALRAKYA